MAEIVAFKPSDDAQTAIIEILEDALAKARSGEMRDIAIVGAIRDEDGPQFWHSYYGQEAYAVLLAGVSSLEFDLHYQRYLERDA